MVLRWLCYSVSSRMMTHLFWSKVVRKGDIYFNTNYICDVSIPISRLFIVDYSCPWVRCVNHKDWHIEHTITRLILDKLCIIKWNRVKLQHLILTLDIVILYFFLPLPSKNYRMTTGWIENATQKLERRGA